MEEHILVLIRNHAETLTIVELNEFRTNIMSAITETQLFETISDEIRKWERQHGKTVREQTHNEKVNHFMEKSNWRHYGPHDTLFWPAIQKICTVCHRSHQLMMRLSCTGITLCMSCIVLPGSSLSGYCNLVYGQESVSI